MTSHIPRTRESLFPRAQRRVWGMVIGAMILIALGNLLLARCVATPPVIGPAGPGETLDLSPALPAQPSAQ